MIRTCIWEVLTLFVVCRQETVGDEEAEILICTLMEGGEGRKREARTHVRRHG